MKEERVLELMYDACIKEMKAFMRKERLLLSYGHKNIFGDFLIGYNDSNRSFDVTVLNKDGVIKIIEDNIDEFSVLPFRRDVLNILNGKTKFTNINQAINACYFEIAMFNYMPAAKKEKFLKLPFYTTIVNKKFNRAKLFEVNKNSIFFDKTTDNQIYQHILNKGFSLIEIPNTFPLAELQKVTDSMSELAKEKGMVNFNVALRIKKLGLYQAHGFYSQKTNTIFLDPRHLVWRHELAHYYVAYNKLIVDDEEAFADSF